MKRIHILKPGTFAGTDGTKFTFSSSNLKAIADNYDPKLGEAPLTVGHPKTDHPAFGWVERLEFDAGSGNLYAVPKQVPAEFESAVTRGAFKKISVALFGPTQTCNPKPGDYYIRHVGFLGAEAPAVPGLSPIEFAAKEAAEISIEFAAPGAYTVAMLFRRVRDWIISTSGLEAADSTIPDYAVSDLEAAARLPDPDDVANSPYFSAKTSLAELLNTHVDKLVDDKTTRADVIEKMAAAAGIQHGTVNQILDGSIAVPPDERLRGFAKVLPISFELMKNTLPADMAAPQQDPAMTAITQASLDARKIELDNQAADLAKKQKLIDDKSAELAAQAATARRATISSLVDGAVSSGRVLPAERGLMVELAARISDGETIEFAAADGSRETVNLFDRWKTFLDSLPPRVTKAEIASQSGDADNGSSATFVAPAGYTVDPEQLEMHNKALAFQAANPKLTYEQAIDQVRKS